MHICTGKTINFRGLTVRGFLNCKFTSASRLSSLEVCNLSSPSSPAMAGFWRSGYKKDFDAVLQRAVDIGITHIINIGVDLETSKQALKQVQEVTVLRVFSTIGVHPGDHHDSPISDEVKDKQLLVERSKGKEFFIAPGGSIEKGETPKQALVRELKEEFQLTVIEDDLEEFGIFYATAAGDASKTIRMDVYIVKNWQGEPTADNEVEQIAWINSNIPEGMKVGSIFEHGVIPRLKKQGLIN